MIKVYDSTPKINRALIQFPLKRQTQTPLAHNTDTSTSPLSEQNKRPNKVR